MLGVRRAMIAPVLLVSGVLASGGCDTVGPYSIKLGRNFYNDVIQQTSADQLLLNLARIHNHEMPLFMEVTEVDATVQVQANVNSATTGIGARPGPTGGTLAGQVASVGGTAQYTEAPTIRYQPLQGAPLIAQLNSPISVDSLVYMFNSDWTLDTVLPLTVDRFTAGYSDYYVALNSIIELDRSNALIIEANQIDESESSRKKGGGKKAAGGGGKPGSGSNALTLFFSPKGLANDSFECDTGIKYTSFNVERVAVHHWLRLLRIYNGIDVHSLHALVQTASSAQLTAIVRRLPNTIHIPATSLRNPTGDRTAPLLRTRSALGVMKSVAEGEYSLAMFVTPKEAANIMQGQPAGSGCRKEHFYVVTDAIVGGTPETERQRVDYRRETDARADGEIYVHRKYMLIQMSDFPPVDAYVVARSNGKFYFISNDDEVSKRMLALLALITSIQAIPAQSGGLQPALFIGAR